MQYTTKRNIHDAQSVSLFHSAVKLLTRIFQVPFHLLSTPRFKYPCPVIDFSVVRLRDCQVTPHNNPDTSSRKINMLKGKDTHREYLCLLLKIFAKHCLDKTLYIIKVFLQNSVNFSVTNFLVQLNNAVSKLHHLHQKANSLIVPL